MTDDFPMEKRAADIFDCDPNFYNMMKAKPLSYRLEWAAYKMCQRGDHEDFASDVMTEAKARIEQLEAALREIYEVYAGSEGIPQPISASEGYLFQLIKDMVAISSAALAGEKRDGETV